MTKFVAIMTAVLTSLCWSGGKTYRPEQVTAVGETARFVIVSDRVAGRGEARGRRLKVLLESEFSETALTQLFRTLAEQVTDFDRLDVQVFTQSSQIPKDELIDDSAGAERTNPGAYFFRADGDEVIRIIPKDHAGNTTIVLKGEGGFPHVYKMSTMRVRLLMACDEGTKEANRTIYTCEWAPGEETEWRPLLRVAHTPGVLSYFRVEEPRAGAVYLTLESHFLATSDHGRSWNTSDLARLVGPNEVCTIKGIEVSDLGRVEARLSCAGGESVVLGHEFGRQWGLARRTSRATEKE